MRDNLSQQLRDCAADPMWAGHAEVPKVLIARAAEELEQRKAKESSLLDLLRKQGEQLRKQQALIQEQALQYLSLDGQASELMEKVERLNSEAASFHMAYRVKCDEETKAQAVEIARLSAERDACRNALESVVRAAQCHNAHHAMTVDGQMLYDIAKSQLDALDAARGGEKT